MTAVGIAVRPPQSRSALALGVAAAAMLALLQLGPAGLPAPAQSAAPAAAGPPLAFVPNAGRLDERVRYEAHAAGASFSFTPTEAVLAFARERKGHVLRLRFLGADPGVEVVGSRPWPGRVNDLRGSDPARWHTGIPIYGEVVYRGLWPGIDLAFRGDGGALKYEFRLAAGANPADVRLAYRGAEGLSLDRAGNLVVATSLGPLTDSRPVSYQQIGGRRVAVDSRYALSGSSYGFALGAYDRSRPLVIDPGVVYSTYLGGFQIDQGNAIAVDASGSAYVVGTTGVQFGAGPNDFPTTAGAFDATYGGLQDAFVAKLSPAGSALVYATFLGGNHVDDGLGVAVDAAGNAYVSGRSLSSDFPTTPGAFDTVSGNKGFVAKLNATGSALLYSTYVGTLGPGNDVAVDAAGNAYVAGSGAAGAYVAKVNATGSALLYTTLLNGSAADVATAIALDDAGSAYLVGWTNSSNFPTTIGAFDRTFNGAEDAFVAKVGPAGSVAYSTYLGGASQEIGRDIGVDAAGSAYAGGHTNSAGFPTANAFDATLNGLQDGFVTKLNAAGSALVYSTYLGGSSGSFAEEVLDLAVDAEGNALVSGGSRAIDFPTTPDAIPFTPSGEVMTRFLTKLDAAGSSLRYSTFLPGAEAWSARVNSGGIAVDAAGAAYLTGLAAGNPFTTTPGAFQTSHRGAGDAFVVKLDTGRPPVPAAVTLSPATDTNPVGTSHSVTAAVSDEDGNRLEGILVRFSVTGSVTISGTCTTDASGECAFAYQGPDFPGADLIAAFADTDEDGVRDEDEPAAEASKSWVVPASTPGQASGGGNFLFGDERIAFGFSARNGDTGARGSCSVVDRAADVMVRCTDVTSFVISDNAVTVYGNALVNGVPTTYRIDAVDNASRGRGNDTFSIQTAGGYARFGTLAGGNVRVG